ncbi:MAG: hypothetical protein ACLP1Y_16305 [Candidatus Acidiferrales bacterium]
MFEAPQEQVQRSRAGLWIGVGIVVVLAVAVGALVYMNSKGSAKGRAPAATPANVKADPVQDLQVVSAKMDKDLTGTMAMWTVEIKNASLELTYNNIAYETTYVGADNKVLLVNQGKIPISIGPREDHSAQFRDVLYPSGVAWFKVRITGATAAEQ